MKLRSIHVALGVLLALVVGYNACSKLGFEPGGKFASNLSSQSGGGGGGGGGGGYVDPTIDPRLRDDDVLHELPVGAAQLAVLCARSSTSQDKVRQVFCGGSPPAIRSLIQLQDALGIGFRATPLPNFALTANSTSLVTKSVSALNPRAIIFTSDPSSFVAMGYVRGERFVELIAGDPVSDEARFYLVKFAQACDATKTCNNGDLYTLEAERDWTSFTLYEDEDVKNTILDCRHCHQTGGPGTRKFLRMQELANPWAHWMESNLSGGKALFADFHAAHGTTEDYAGIPANQIDQANPPALEALVRLRGDTGFNTNTFNSVLIESQVEASSPAQPESNAVPGRSAAWNTIYNKFLAGQAIAVPYHDEKVTDANKVAVAAEAYADYLAGNRAASQIPDMTKLFPDDANILAELGFRIKPASSPQSILLQACAQCHNSKLDQTLDRAKFNVDLSKVSADEKAKAISRISMATDSLYVMPPRRFRTLTPAEIQALTDLLSK